MNNENNSQFNSEPSFHENWIPNTLHLRYDSMITIKLKNKLDGQ